MGQGGQTGLLGGPEFGYMGQGGQTGLLGGPELGYMGHGGPKWAMHMGPEV